MKSALRTATRSSTARSAGAAARGTARTVAGAIGSTGKVTEENANYSDAYVLRLAALWKPTEALAITPGIVYQNSKEHDDSTYWPAYSNPGNGQYRNATPERLPVPDEYWLPTLKIEYSLAKSQIISNTSYYSRDQKTGYQGTAYDL